MYKRSCINEISLCDSQILCIWKFFRQERCSFWKISSWEWKLISITLITIGVGVFALWSASYSAPDQLYRDPGTEELNERIRLFPYPRNAENHRPVSRRKKSCGRIQKVSQGISGVSSIASARKADSHARWFTRCWCQTSKVFGDFQRKTSNGK